MVDSTHSPHVGPAPHIGAAPQDGADAADPAGTPGRFGIALVVLARRWRRVLDDRLGRVGLTDATWAPLMHLADAGQALSQRELAARIGVEGSSLVRLLDILAEGGLIERRVDACDKRVNRLYLTAAGRETVATIHTHMAQVEDEILAALPAQQVAQCLATFESLDRRLRQLLGGNDSSTP